MKDSKEKLEKTNYIPQSSPFPADKDMQEGNKCNFVSFGEKRHNIKKYDKNWR